MLAKTRVSYFLDFDLAQAFQESVGFGGGHEAGLVVGVVNGGGEFGLEEVAVIEIVGED